MKTKIFFDINFKMEGVILSFWHFNFSNKNMHVRRTMPYKFFLYSNNIIFKCNCFYEQFSKKKNYKHIYTVYYVVRNKKTPLNYLYASTEFLYFLLIWPRQIFTSLSSIQIVVRKVHEFDVKTETWGWVLTWGKSLTAGPDVINLWKRNINK